MQTLVNRPAASPTTPVQGVIFDVDGTLYNQDALRRRIIPRLAAAHWNKPAIGLNAVRVLQAYREAHEQLRNQTFSADLQLAATASKCGLTIADVRAIVDQWFDRAPLDLLPSCEYPGLPELLQFLARLGISCGVFSDYPAEAKLRAMGLAHFFSRVLSAADIGRQKPDPTGILAVARQMGVAPEHTLYVGDRTIDLEAASSAGMQGFLIQNRNSYSFLHDRFAEYVRHGAY